MKPNGSDKATAGMAENIIFLITDLDLGGSPLVVRSLVRGLRATGRWNPTVISIKSAGVVAKWIRLEGNEVFSLHARSAKDIDAVRRYCRIVNHLEPQIIFSTLVHANLLASLCKRALPTCRYVQSIHTLQDKPNWHWHAQGLISRAADAVVAPSQAVLNKIAAYGHFTRGVVIANGVDVEELDRTAPIPTDELPWDASRQIVGYVGRFDPVKNLDRLILEFSEALIADYAAWQNVHLALVGYGKMEPQLKSLARQYGIRSHVHFCGPTAQPAAWIKHFDVTVMPSMVEGFGLTVVESMACGIPVAAYDVPAVNEIVTNEDSGVLANPHQPGALMAAIFKLLHNPEARRAIQERGRVLAAERYSYRHMIEAYDGFLHRL